MSTGSQRLVVRWKPSPEKDEAWQLGPAAAPKGTIISASTVNHEEFFKESVSNWVGETLEGRNLTILAYGLPCTGKSYTVFGSPGESRTNPNARGIIVRCLDELTKRIQDSKSVVAVKGSFCHVTSDGQVSDLIDAKKRKLQVKKLDNSTYSIPDATQQPLTTTQDAVSLVEKALLMRNATGIVRREKKFSVNGTASSRINPLTEYKAHSTHAIFQYTIECCNRVANNDESATTSLLTIVDLAGHGIKELHEESDSKCEDVGLMALRATLLKLGSGDEQAASESCLSSPLTQLLYSGLFGGSRCVLINTLPTATTDEVLARGTFDLCQNVLFCKPCSDPVPLPLSSTSPGLKLAQIEELRKAVLLELTNEDLPSSKLEIVNNGTVKINGQIYSQLSSTAQDNILSIRDKESQLISKRNQPMNRIPMSRRPPLPPLDIAAAQRARSFPPLNLQTPTPTLLQSPPPSFQKLLPTLKSSTPTAAAPTNEQQAFDIKKDEIKSLSSEESTSSMEEVPATPTAAVSAVSPPPLKDIPHILPLSPTKQSNNLLTISPLLPVPRPAAGKTNDKSNHLPQKAQSPLQKAGTVQAVISLPLLPPVKANTKSRNTVTPSSNIVSPSSSSSSTPQQSQEEQLRRKKSRKRKSRIKTTRATSTSPTARLLSQSPNRCRQTSSTSSSSTSDSDSVDNEDPFDPNFQPRRLTFQPQVPLLMPSPRINYPRRLSPLPMEQPSSTPVPIGSLTNQTAVAGVLHLPLYEESVTAEGGQAGSYSVNGQISDHELHLSAMAGVKSSLMKRLVMKYGVDYRDHGGRTALMYSVLGNHPKMTELLISMGAEVDAKDNTQLTALFWAVYQAKSEVIKVLLKNGASIHVCDNEKRTVFHWVMRTPNVHCLKTLCKYASGDIQNQTDHEGLSPLHWAVMCEQPHHITTLLSLVPATEVCAQDPKGRTALNYAVLIFSPICIKAILDRCPTVANFKDDKGRTALHYACAEGSADCVRTLLACKSCDLHATDNTGTTCLHWAAAANQPGIVQLLLRRGANRSQADHDGLTPLDHACQRGFTECVKLLETTGLQRQPSSWSLTSQFSLHPPTPPELDEHGHVPMRRPVSSSQARHISNLSPSTGSLDRLPADGHSVTEIVTEQEQTATKDDPESDPKETLITVLVPVEGASRTANLKRRIRKWFCSCGSHSNVVLPAAAAATAEDF